MAVVIPGARLRRAVDRWAVAHGELIYALLALAVVALFSAVAFEVGRAWEPVMRPRAELARCDADALLTVRREGAFLVVRCEP